MPAGDGTGPDGRGGWCTPLWMSGQIPRPLGGIGFGRGSYGRRAPGTGGRGRGRMNMFYATGQPGWARTWLTQPTVSAPQPVEVATADKDHAIGFLKNQIDSLEQQLADAKKRLEELEKK